MAVETGLPPGPTEGSELELAMASRAEWAMSECRRQYGDVFSIRVPGIRAVPTRCVMLGNPDDVRTLTRADSGLAIVDGGRERMRRFIGDASVLTLDGEPHRARRRLLLPPFHGEALTRIGEIFIERANAAIDSWPAGSEFLLGPRLRMITFSSLTRALFGIQDERRRDRLGRLIWIVSRAWEGPEIAEENAASRAALDRLIEDEMERHRELVAKGELSDILCLLLAATDEDGQAIDEEEVRSEVSMLLMTGHDTVAVTLGWALEYLLRDPKLTATLTEEALTGGRRWTDAVIHETLRLRPALPYVDRELVRPWKVGGYDLEPGTVLLACYWLVNHDADSYADPDEFRPERFLDQEPDRSLWMPFGSGRRRCIGSAYAALELRIVLQRILARTRLELVEPDVPEHGVWRTLTLNPGETPAILHERR